MAELLPNFLVVGFAKCGTTSLVNKLSDHNQIFIPKEKELRYFTYEFLKNSGYKGPGDYRPKRLAVKTVEDYKKKFDISKEFKSIGEASTDISFYYKQTIPKIKTLLDDPKIIIMLRNPTDRAISAYSHLIREERETLSFEEALNIENERIKSGYEFIWGYEKASCYYESVKAFKENFSQVHIVFFEDFITHSEIEIQKILNFLGVENSISSSTSHHNKTGKPKNIYLNRFLNRKLWIKELLKKLIGEKISLEIKEKLQRKNLSKVSIDDEIKSKLNSKFNHDILNLEKLLDENLSHWKQ
ncbi:MAG: sulfotransferase [Psychroflexus sp.]|nr:sulfotransferase [Psychroflexus sp.]